ncbi:MULTISPECIES: cytochrome c oxidase subunit 2A [Ornithinibacillus]|uniref:Cytochrome c oxidase subunit 2A n=2 Tax=Ornithinibacillus TaxID=484508 RepID=A0A923L613_9BACI|nr:MULTISPECIES: cytochrome c oxidase subunit 2A [Ornithinibacillus]MBC5637030.1 cytochrome c oxidase subunit 2A [Ornithinibacillus hominis]MBS3679760.1 cytochrome c oxidase subunit 2A [Ornithinibacillus massiliensis]
MRNQETKKASEKEKPELKGTFISVMLLGVFIIISWIGAFALFISR